MANESLINRGTANQTQANKRDIIIYAKGCAWGDFENIGIAPTTFNSFVSLMSLKYYPFNFIINYIKDDYEYEMIINEEIYKRIIDTIHRNDCQYLYLFVHLLKAESDGEEEEYTNGIKQSKQIKKDKQVKHKTKTSGKRLTVLQAIKEEDPTKECYSESVTLGERTFEKNCRFYCFVSNFNNKLRINKAAPQNIPQKI